MRSRYVDIDDRMDDLADRMRADPDLATEFHEKYELSWLYHENALEGVVYSPQELATALAGPTLTDATNEYFNDAPTGEILSTRAEAVTVAPFKDASYFKYHDALQNAVTRVFDGVEDQQTSWDTWVAEVEAF